MAYNYNVDELGRVVVWSPYIDPEQGPMCITGPASDAGSERDARAICDKLNGVEPAPGEIMREVEAANDTQFAAGLRRALQLVEMEVCENV